MLHGALENFCCRPHDLLILQKKIVPEDLLRCLLSTWSSSLNIFVGLLQFCLSSTLQMLMIYWLHNQHGTFLGFQILFSVTTRKVVLQLYIVIKKKIIFIEANFFYLLFFCGILKYIRLGQFVKVLVTD